MATQDQFSGSHPASSSPLTLQHLKIKMRVTAHAGGRRTSVPASAPRLIGGQATAAAAAEAPMPSASPSGRKIVFAVDGTVGCEEALRWTVQQLAQKGGPAAAQHECSTGAA